MLRFSSLFLAGALYATVAQARYVFYYDQYHTNIPNNTVNAGIDHVITAFANSSLFTTSPAGEYVPFENITSVRSHFDNNTKILIAIGGWADNTGFSAGVATESSRKLFASNVAALLGKFGFDGVNMDWEYPGGNGADYRQKPNSERKSEIDTYPMLLAEIRAAIGPNKLLTIATPGKVVDMIAYTPEKAPSIWKSVDWVNVMTYDLMNRRDNVTKHHTDVKASLEVVDYYINTLSLDPAKINLGFAMYAKWFTLDPSKPCENGLNCTTVMSEDANGLDTGKSGATTFEASNYAKPLGNMTASVNGACGPKTSTFCATGMCCSSAGFCGNTDEYCNNCLGSAYGSGCNEIPISAHFQMAVRDGLKDEQAGGAYYYDQANHLFWTFDTPELIARKFTEIVDARKLGGVMAWSLGEDSHDFSHVLALQKENAARKNSSTSVNTTINAQHSWKTGNFRSTRLIKRIS
ncbi:unnamed protein product [Blumeria hordei]|uniref:chitinase n=3 Tax=Blumeria TaxID=34372 RepID=A0A383URK1_BLUHO|nr:extracellular chitinase [Blumeria graminis]CCU79984.1 Chi1/extracellular endochitinase [Blumeria hordei DH14]SZF01882.1 unnamed protein product [Blumeria hordei]